MLDNEEYVKKNFAVLSFSGGQDSTTCLFWALNQGWDVHAVTIAYGQRHAIELQAAAAVIEYARTVYPGREITHELVTLPDGILAGTSPLVSAAELEQYADFKSLPGGLEKTFVPMRNQLFITICANRAYVRRAETLILGICEEDYGGYPDCRYEFFVAIADASDKGTFTAEAGYPNGLMMAAPLMHLSKAATVQLAVQTPGCYGALALSHTAYDGAYPPVGHDHATLLRQKGFAEAGVADPLLVRAWADGKINFDALPNDPAYKDEKQLLHIAASLPERNF